ncbi:hypothetical protein [Bradyrhizobium sp.]|uniref:hypothetical protein n=1 Tax=Bradyrhizobium sp. TaxID=376 RepID=UPI0039E2ADF8
MLSLALLLSNGALADPLSMDFTFRGTKGCLTLFSNPEIRLKQLPAGAKLVLLTLQGPNHRDMGGQEITLPSDGVIPAEAIRTFAPCNPGLYTYKAVVKAKDGAAIGTAEAERPFPSE